MKMRRSFWKYYKDNGLWKPISIIVLSGIIGITAYFEGSKFMMGFMSTVVLTMIIGDYITWRKRG